MERVPGQVAFFREGLQRYAEASETVKYFQECVSDAIARTFEAKVGWKHFVPVLTEGRLEIRRAPGRVYLSSYILGTVHNRSMDRAWMTLGLYWDPPQVGNGSAVVAAAYVSDESGRQMLDLYHQSPGGPLTVGPLYNRRERRLIMVANADFDPDLSFRQLLDAADEALASSETSAPTEGD